MYTWQFKGTSCAEFEEESVGSRGGDGARDRIGSEGRGRSEMIWRLLSLIGLAIAPEFTENYSNLRSEVMVSELAGKNFPNSLHVIHYIQIKFGKVSLLIVECRREIKLRIEIQKGGSPHHSAH
jgi:hypothetical protein